MCSLPSIQNPGELSQVEQKEKYTTQDVANLLGVSDQTVRSYIERGFIKAARYYDRGRYYIDHAELVAYAQAHGVTLPW